LDLKAYGFIPESNNVSAVPARVICVHRERYDLVCEYGEISGRLKTKEYYDGTEDFPTTGDFVLIDYIPGSDSRIIRTLPRRTFFSRRDPTPGRGEQAVAANFDYVFIMQSLNHDFNANRLQRYLTLAWQSGALPVVLLTKADLSADYTGQLRAAQNVAGSVPVFAVSAKTGYGLDALTEYIKPGKTVVFLGSSGVGKSSLVNALAGEELMAVNSIREDDSKGRHTTTYRQLLMLSNGTMIIDTPGMRELGMWDVSGGLGEAFPDVEAVLGQCRFSDCRHESEPGCAVREAIKAGILSEDRWKSYVSLKQEARFSEDKTAYRRHKAERFKEIAKKNRESKKGRKNKGGNPYDD